MDRRKAKTEPLAAVQDPVIEMRRELARKILAFTRTAGKHSTATSDLTLFHRIEPSPCYRAVYEPSLTIFVQGQKRIHMGATDYLCGGSSFLLSSIDVPVQSLIVEASEETPLLSMFLRLDMSIVREVMSRDNLPESEKAPHRRSVAVGETTAGLLEACLRLVALLNNPEDIPFLAPLIQREIVYRILRTPQAARLPAIATSGDLSQRTTRAIA